MEKKSLNEMPDTDMLSRESVSMDSLTENTLSDDEKEAAAAKRLHEKALQKEQEEQKGPMTDIEKKALTILYAICVPCYTVIIGSFLAFTFLTTGKSETERLQIFAIYCLHELALAAILLIILLIAMKLFPNINKKIDVLIAYDILFAICPFAYVVEYPNILL